MYGAVKLQEIVTSSSCEGLCNVKVARTLVAVCGLQPCSSSYRKFSNIFSEISDFEKAETCMEKTKKQRKIKLFFTN